MSIGKNSFQSNLNHQKNRNKILETSIKYGIYDLIYLGYNISFFMARKKLTEQEIEQQKEEQKIRAEASRAARRSGKSIKLEGKVTKSKAKTQEARSSKKIAAVRKRSRS